MIATVVYQRVITTPALHWNDASTALPGWILATVSRLGTTIGMSLWVTARRRTIHSTAYMLPVRIAEAIIDAKKVTLFKCHVSPSARDAGCSCFLVMWLSHTSETQVYVCVLPTKAGARLPIGDQHAVGTTPSTSTYVRLGLPKDWRRPSRRRTISLHHCGYCEPLRQLHPPMRLVPPVLPVPPVQPVAAESSLFQTQPMGLVLHVYNCRSGATGCKRRTRRAVWIITI